MQDIMRPGWNYFNSLVIHNTLFDATAYAFLGFTISDGILKAVVKQPYIPADGQANLDDVRRFLLNNGFINTRRQDYFNKEYGLILTTQQLSFAEFETRRNKLNDSTPQLS